jgi:hypothetical protein
VARSCLCLYSAWVRPGNAVSLPQPHTRLSPNQGGLQIFVSGLRSERSAEHAAAYACAPRNSLPEFGRTSRSCLGVSMTVGRLAL